MTHECLLTHFDKIADAPDAISHLRRFILNLAVKGKLVDQNQNDESAAELLNRIQSERTLLISEGLTSMESNLVLFDLPAQWIWIRLGNLIISADSGWSPRSEGFPRSGNNWGVIKVSAVSWDRFLPDENKQLLPGISPPKEAQIHKGDFLISRANTSELVAKCVVVEEQPHNLILSDKIVRLKLTDFCNKRFVSLVNNHARHARDHYASHASGTSLSMKNVSRSVIYDLPIPFPPLAEQHRIVAKVDELMALCDRLEAAQGERESRRDRLAAASLQRLNQPADAPAFREHARFHLSHLQRLTARPEQIKQLRQTILNLAVRGLLIEPKPNGQLLPFLNEVREARLSLDFASGDKLRIEAELDSLESDLRDGNQMKYYISTRSICDFITKGTTPAANELSSAGEIPFLKVYNIVNNKIDFDYRATFISEEIHRGKLKRSIVRPGDVLMNIVGPPLGKVAVVTDQYPEWNVNQALAIFRPIPLIDSRFLSLVLSASITIEAVLKQTRGTVGQDNLSLEQVRSVDIPLVTLPEQHRIVAKVDELMALCDRLEAQLTTTQTQSRRLLEAVLHEALAGA